MVKKIIQYADVFTFLSNSNSIHHYGGLNLHLKAAKGASNGDSIDLESDVVDASKFYPKDANGDDFDVHSANI